MSAIAGILFFDGREAGGQHLQGMLDRIAHRGPDGRGTWWKGPVALGHLMLHTTPESLREHLPLAQGDLAITADARIDNRDELLAALGEGRGSAGEISDSELILRAFRRWGEPCVARLVGDFAFAIWDGRNEQLFCARDHLGVKPFYYHLSDGSFAFASDARAILSLPWVPQRLNDVRIADYLQPISNDRRITFYEGIYRLPAAHTLTIAAGDARIKRYWSLDPGKSLKLSSDREYADAFRKIFLEAVRCRLRCAFPVGASLSGGLDSSSVACSASKILGEEGAKRLSTFSAIFPDLPECDESRYIKAVAAHTAIDPVFVRVDLLSPLADFEEVLRQVGEPAWIPNTYLWWSLCSAARQNEVRVLLTGFEGDIVVSHGHLQFLELIRSWRLWDLLLEIEGAHKERQVPYHVLLWSYCFLPLLPARVLRRWRRFRGRDRDALNRLIDERFARRIGLEERIQELEVNPKRPRTLREEHHRSLEQGMIQHTLEATDRIAAAFSLEFRHPFFDRRLVEFCLSLPPEQKLRRGWTRWILRQAMAGILPEMIRCRPGKIYLGANFRRGLRSSDKQLLKEVIWEDSNWLEGYVDIEALRQAYRRFESDSAQGNELPLWAPVTLALWLKSLGSVTSNI